jgi:hypothetical protein
MPDEPDESDVEELLDASFELDDVLVLAPVLDESPDVDEVDTVLDLLAVALCATPANTVAASAAPPTAVAVPATARLRSKRSEGFFVMRPRSRRAPHCRVSASSRPS